MLGSTGFGAGMRIRLRSGIPISLMLFAICCFLILAGFSKKAPILRQSLEIYSRQRGTADRDAASRLAKLKSAGSDPVKGFVAKLDVGLKSERLPVLADIVELPWRNPNLAESASGWVRQDDRFVWMPGPRRKPLVVPFFKPRSASPLRLSDFDELWVDYRDLAARNACVPSAGMMLRSGDSGSSINADTAAGTKTIDVAKARWSKKGYRYIAGRMLGLPLDDIWRYTQFGQFVVLQRRFHEDLSDLAEIALVFQGDVPGAHVNLRVRFSELPGPTELLQLGEVTMSARSDGRNVARIDMKKVLGKRLSDFKGKAYLQEITVFVRGKEEKVVEDRPFREVNFYRGSLIGKIDSITPLQKRFVLDLRMLPRQGTGILSWGNVRFSAYDPEGICAVQLETIRLVSFFDRVWPAFLQEGAGLVRRWGGPFIAEIGSGTRLEWPGVRGYLSFESTSPEGSALLFDDRRSLVTVDVERHQAKIEPKTVPEPESFSMPSAAGSVPADRRLVQGAGYRFRSDEAITGAMQARDGLVLEGYGKWIELAWPISARLDPATRFFAALPEGSELIAKSVLTLDMESGQSASRGFAPNRPVLLDAGAERIKAVRLRLDLNRSPYRLKLKEMALFNPGLLAAEEAFEERRPVSQPITRRLYPEIVEPSSKRRVRVVGGRLLGIALSNAARKSMIDWTTRIKDDTDWVQGVRFSYHVPRALQEHDSCWLNLTIRWDRRSVSRDVCLAQADGNVLLPLARLLDWKDDLATFGAMRSIDWKVRQDRRLLGSDDLAFNFGMELEGMGMRTIRQELQDWDALGLKNEEQTEPEPDERLARGILKRPIRLAVGGQAIAKIIAGGINSPEHPYFRLNSVTVEPRAPLSSQAWRAFIGMPNDNHPFRWRGVLGLLLCLAGLVWSLSSNRRLSFPELVPHYVQSSVQWIDRTLAHATVKADAVMRTWGYYVLFGTALPCAVFFFAKGLREGTEAANGFLLTLGGLTVVAALRGLIGSIGPWLRIRHPTLADYVDGTRGVPYFASALLLIVVTAAFSLATNEMAADQAAMIACYCLAIGLGKELYPPGKRT